MPDLNTLLEKWACELSQALEMMTGQPFKVSAPAAREEPRRPVLWWTQALSIGPGASFSVGAGASVWFELGTRALQGAGVDVVEESEARSTWLEIAQQSVGGAMRGSQAIFGKAVECGESSEEAPAAGSHHFVVTVTASDGTTFDVGVAVSAVVRAAVTPEPEKPAPLATETAAGTRSGLPSSKTMEVLLDVHLPVSISFGTAQLALKDVLKLATGSVVELNRLPEEPVDIIVNDYVIARGEVVVVDGNYAVRIQEIVSRQQRLGISEGAGRR